MSVPLFPSVDRFFHTFPEAKDLYGNQRLYHLTHSRYLPDIKREGLRPNRELFPPAHGAFLLKMCQRYGSGHPSDSDYIKNRILDPSILYLSTEQPDMEGRLGYGIPERLVFLMRGLNALATKSALSEDERSFAAQAHQEHHHALTDGEPSIVALEIDPLAPTVVNNRLGHMALDSIRDGETALDVVKYIDGPYGNNIPVQGGTVEPVFITEFWQVPLDPTLLSTTTEPGWTTSIR